MNKYDHQNIESMPPEDAVEILRDFLTSRTPRTLSHLKSPYDIVEVLDHAKVVTNAAVLKKRDEIWRK